MRKTLFLLLLLFVFSSCGLVKKNKAKTGKCVCVLFDLSYSTHRKNVRQSYAADIRKVMEEMNPGDVLVAGLITQKSISELRFCVQYEFKPFKATTDNPLYKKAEKSAFLKSIRSIKDSLLTVIDSTLYDTHRKILKTEIMGALQVADRIFRVYDLPQNILVIMSDMIEDSQFYRFQNENLSDRRIRAIINNEKKNERLPSLTNVKVYVTGAMAKNRKKQLRIQKFWQEYFRTCGANLRAKNYGSAMIRFEK